MTSAYKKPFYRARQKLMGKFMLKPQPKPLLYCGEGSVLTLCATIAQFGINRLLLVTDKPLRDLGVMDGAVAALQAAGVETVIYDGVLPDPTVSVVNAGIACFHEHGCDAVMAFGGGSSIDAAKVIALAAGNQCQAQDCMGVGKCKAPARPFFAVPTTAGTGSEATFIAVISDDTTHAKNAVIDPSLIPMAAALDAGLMRGLPPAITAATGMDALTHAIESYIGRWETPQTNFYGLAATRLVIDNLATACRDGSDIQARQSMALASFYGGLAITNALVGYVHAVSHNLGARYGVPHGLGNAMVLPHVLELMKHDASKKLAELAVHAQLGDASQSDAALAQALIDKVIALNDEIGIPRTTDVIRTEDIDELLDAIIAEGASYPCPRFLSRAECRGILDSISAA
ncbi:MAG: iron-containing alcohol dehydrogenase [Gammaproteobacteria bacterium]|nr:iron-containing alcohol dehydrogenase [Gammaproteobacteria bacterium]